MQQTPAAQQAYSQPAHLGVLAGGAFHRLELALGEENPFFDRHVAGREEAVRAAQAQPRPLASKASERATGTKR